MLVICGWGGLFGLVVCWLLKLLVDDGKEVLHGGQLRDTYTPILASIAVLDDQ
jgi:hypothetical protein